MKPLTEFLASHGNGAGKFALNLMHTANGEDFLSIIETGAIRATPCRVFNNEQISYFFLGRPAYKTEISYDPSHWQLPAVFVFDRNLPHSSTRAFPFDSGAWSDKRFQSAIGRLKRDIFNIGGDPENLDRLIKVFFETETRYSRAQPVAYQKIGDLIGNEISNIAPLALAKLYNHTLNSEIDDRAKIIELQYSVDISLKCKSFKGIICCEEWQRDPIVKLALDKLEIEVKTYPILPLSSSSYYSSIYAIPEQFK